MNLKEASESVGEIVEFREHRYRLVALIKRWTPKGIIWQLELLWMNDNVRSVIIADPKEVIINDRIK